MSILYHNNLSEFRNDISRSIIASRIKESGYTDEVGKNPSLEEEESWQKSLGAICEALRDLDGNFDVYAEYAIPPESLHRVDFMITGLNVQGKNTAILVELKQWSDGSIYLRDNQPDFTVHARWDNEDKDHPSHQASRYKHLLHSHCTSVRDGEVIIQTCVFLHNYSELAGVVNDPRFATAVNRSHIYYKGQEALLAKFISEQIIKPDLGDTVLKLENPNSHILDPRLIDTITTTLEGGKSFVLTPGQWTVFSGIKDAYVQNTKTVVVITGAPGTGKTVLALRLMGEFRRRHLGVRYVTLSQNLRYLFIDRLCSDHEDMERRKGNKLTPEQKEEYRLGAEAMISAPYFRRDALFREISVVDEAHRLTKMEQNHFNPERYDNRAEYIIENSTLSIFLIDDDQQVRWEDYVTTSIIENYAKKKGYVFISHNLKEGIRQYTPYIEWVTALFSSSPVNLIMNPARYQVTVYDKASELYSKIIKLNEQGFRSRILAGYCWRWVTRGRDKTQVRPVDCDIIISDKEGHVDLQLMWNLTLNRNDYGGTWIGRDDSIDEVGCIHTAQGVDMDYVGVIIGNDITFNTTTCKVEFHVEEHPSDDFSVTIDRNQNRKVDAVNAERLLRNAYRVLMTRSTKGCLIFCEDKNLSDYIRALFTLTVQ